MTRKTENAYLTIRVHRQNKISQLPGNLEAMASLQVLSLSSNLLEELPDAIAGLHR